MNILTLAVNCLLITSLSQVVWAQAPIGNPPAPAPVPAAVPAPTISTSTPTKARGKKTRTPKTPESVASPAFATPTGSNRTGSTESPQSGWAWAKARMSVGGFISSASELALDGTSASAQNQNVKGSGNFNTSSALGLEAQLIEYRNETWGWFGGASIEQSREIASMKLDLSQNNKILVSFKNKPVYRPLVLSGGVVYKYNERLYGLAGLNYTIYKELGGGDFEGASMDAKPGFQIGAAFKPDPRLAIEVAYKDIRYSFGGRLGGVRLSSDDMKLQGIALTGRYSLE